MSEGFRKINESLLSKLNNPNIQSVIIITFFLFLSRIFGFLRNVIIYQRMDPIASDLLISATAISEVIVTFLIMGTVTNSVLPTASKIKEKMGDKKLSSYITFVNLSLGVVLGALSLILFVFTETALKFITSPEAWNDFANAGLTDDYVNVTRILLLTPILFSIQTVFGIFLTIKKRFLVYSLAGVIYNLGMIAGLLIGDESNYYYTAWGMVFGSITAITIYFLEAKRNGFKGLSYLLLSFVDDLKLHKENLLKTWSFFLPRIMMLNGVVIANVLMKNVADGAGGQITAFDIGLSIQNVFFAVITSISAVFFPDLARSFVDEANRKEFWGKLKRYAEYTAGISLVGSILTFVFAPVVMWAFTLFGKGQGSAEYIIYIARIASLSFVFLSVNEIINKYFYVKEKVWSPVIISSIGAISQIITTYYLDQNSYDAGLSVGLGMLANGLVAFSIAFLVIRKDMKEEIGSSKKQKITDFGENRENRFDTKNKNSYSKSTKSTISEDRSLVKRDIHFKLPIKKMGGRKK